MATVKLNNSLSMIGDQKAKMDVFFSSPIWLHMGRIPEGIGPEDVFPVAAFVGCMTNLKVAFINFITVFNNTRNNLN